MHAYHFMLTFLPDATFPSILQAIKDERTYAGEVNDPSRAEEFLRAAAKARRINPETGEAV